MRTDFTRRGVMAAATFALLATTAKGATQTSNEPSSAIKTRKASCNCGQLTATVVGPDPERRSLCHCKNCQMRTGSAFSIQTRYPRTQVTVAGKSKAWKFPVAGAKPVSYRSCDSEGVTYYFCPECGSNVFYDIDVAPDFVGIKVGAFTDPTFPQPMISGFEEYKFPWVMNIASIPMPHVE